MGAFEFTPKKKIEGRKKVKKKIIVGERKVNTEAGR